MAKLTRKHQKVFAGSATNNGQFGSAQAGTKVTTTDLDTMQALSAFDTGWNDAVISSQKLPPLEEFQALDHIATRQLAYLFQEGIPEYNSSCEYHQYSVVKKAGTYELYGSKINTNTGNALPAAVSDSNWQYLGSLASMGGLSAASNSESNDGVLTTKALVPANFAQQSKTLNGYQKFPSGIILQWGETTSLTTNFPITYPTGCFSIVVTDTDPTPNVIAVTSITASQFTTSGDNSGCWISIGY